MLSFSLIVPTRNAGEQWPNWLNSLHEQSLQPNTIILVDSSSEDDTLKLASDFGITPYVIDKEIFNHGGTRNLAVTLSPKTDVLVFLTQDAILNSHDALQNIISIFEDPNIVAVNGRQLPHIDANPLAIHARLFNYPDKTIIKSMMDIPTLGLKTAFMSNSFAAYRRDIFEKLGRFPANTILAEDMYLAAKMILSGYKVAYCAETTVRHSHNYTPWEEFRRYFDTGVFHACEPWIQQKFGGASGEGMRYIQSELSYLLKNAPGWIPRALITNMFKFAGYKLGRNYQKIPMWLRPKLSMYKSYWLQQ